MSDKNEINQRLKDAYDLVEFFANSTWVHTSHDYHRANQELFVRESLVQNAMYTKYTHPRTVRDTIPQSKLAQYSNYEYDHERELSYAPTPRTSTIFCPCVCTMKTTKEPWMHPDIEAYFIWYSYTPDVDTIKLTTFQQCRDCKLSYSFLQNFPFYSRLCELRKNDYLHTVPSSNAKLKLNKPPQLKADTTDEMILRIKIKSERVKLLWSQYSQPKIESVNEEKNHILKSPMGNDFVLDKNKEYQQERWLNKEWALDVYHVQRMDFASLQYLKTTLKTLRDTYFTCIDTPTLSESSNQLQHEESEVDSKTPPASTRRLYSAVLQGLRSDHSKIETFTDVHESFPSPRKSPEASDGKKNNLALLTTSSLQSTERVEHHETSKCFMELHQEQAPSSSGVFVKSHPFKSVSSCYYSENPSSTLTNSAFSTNSYLNTIPNNGYVHMQYPNFYTNSYANPYHTTNSYQSNQLQINSRIPQFNRQPYPSNSMHPMWFLPQNRSPPIYSMAHYTSQPYVYLPSQQVPTPSPQPPPHQNQCWQHPMPYVRPPSLQTYHMPQIPSQYPTATAPQHWLVHNQNISRVSSNQHDINASQLDYRSKTATKKLNSAYNTHYKVRTKSQEEPPCGYIGLMKRHESAATDKQFTVKTAASNSSLEYRQLKRCGYEKTMDLLNVGKGASPTTFMNNTENLVPCDWEELHVPVSASLSEDLERQALEQYQNSNENFYQELEKQAEEQYDGYHSENWLCPPYQNHHYIGGLIILRVLFY